MVMLECVGWNSTNNDVCHGNGKCICAVIDGDPRPCSCEYVNRQLKS